jgi:hypothetical protein
MGVVGEILKIPNLDNLEYFFSSDSGKGSERKKCKNFRPPFFGVLAKTGLFPTSATYRG